MKSYKNFGLLIVLSLFFSIGFANGHTGGEGGDKTPAVKGKKDPILLTFANGVKVPKSEFEYIYQKNNGGWDAAKKHNKEQYMEYLSLYINFKRKVMEAEELKLHETPAFKQEFEGYRKQLAKPYMVDQNTLDRLIKEAYDRSKTMIAASHILIPVGPDAAPDDTLAGYKKAMDIKKQIDAGDITFEDAAVQYSKDPSVKNNKGYLGYFSVFDMVYPFETGAFNTDKGKISKPVRTGYGYHLIKVSDRVQNSGTKKCAHVIIRIGNQYSAKDTASALKKINEIHQKLKDGANFKEIVESYSDDPLTINKGGDLGTGRLIPEMELVKMKLGKGEFSEPFESPFGWHILTVTEVEEMKSFEDSQEEIKAKITRDARSFLSREKLIRRVKDEYNFSLNQANFDAHINSIEDNMTPQYMRGVWKADSLTQLNARSIELYKVGTGKDVHVGTLADYLNFYRKARKGFDGATIEQYGKKLLELFIESEMQKFYETQLPNIYPEYRELLREYRDGILLFTLTEDKVWKKAVEDTSGLKTFYDNHTAEFKASERIEVVEYRSEKEGILEKVQKMLEEGKSDEAIEAEINKTSSLNLKIRTLTIEKGKTDQDDLFTKHVGYKTGIISASMKAKRILRVQKKIKAGIKTFDEARSECITKYQNHLEATWLEQLEKKYPVAIDEKTVKKLFK